MSSPVDASGPDIGPVTVIRTGRAALADGAIASAPPAADAMIEAASSAWRRIGRPYTNDWRENHDPPAASRSFGRGRVTWVARCSCSR